MVRATHSDVGWNQSHRRFYYVWGRATPATERSLKKVKSFPIDESDSEMRRSRQRTIGRIQRLRLRASTVGASVGAVFGATVSLFVWLTAQIS